MGTVRANVCMIVLILHASLTTKITVTLFTIISTYSPLAAEKSGGTIDRVTTDSPYNEARCTGAWLYVTPNSAEITYVVKAWLAYMGNVFVEAKVTVEDNT